MTLSFKKDMELQYQEYSYEKIVLSSRLTYAFALILFIIFGIMDFLFMKEAKMLAWVIRVGVIAPIFLIMYCLTYFPIYFKV
ncbi:MAG: hypothetical protein PHR06_14035, partial [Candidatus Cloacimonetes bacterium]|nr:hypothetical protein [Candidatus Cloacimonadota bacterium]